jgi:hypothetical protein
LAHVSKYFSNVARPFRYQSLAISGIDQVVDLSTRLENTPAHMRRIRHLFISDHSHLKIERHRTAKRLGDHGKNAIIRILNLAAPTAETLTLHASSPSTSTSLIAALFAIHFPRLVELTVIGFYPFPRVPGSMPRLTHLHLCGNRNPHGLLHMQSIRLACPNLTHLRISGLTMALSFVEELTEALRASDGSDNQSSALFAPQLPPKLRILMIQPGPVPSASIHTSASVKDRMMMERLVEVVDTSVNPHPKGVDVVLVERDTLSVDGSSTYENVRREWSVRSNGGEGCWAVRS